MVIMAIVGYVVTLVLLALAIGFSPILYGMMVRFASDGAPKSNERWLIVGVLAGILSMFLVGNTIAFVVETIRTAVGQGGTLSSLLVGLLGLALICSVIVHRSARRVRVSPRRKRFLTSGGLIFAIGFVRTITSVSGLGAMVIISTATASRSIPWFVTIVVLMPIVCLIAIAPFIALSRGSHWQLRFYQKAVRLSEAGKRKAIRYRSLLETIVFVVGLGLVAYACRGILW